MQIAGSGEVGLVRNPLGVIGLTLITLGIDGIVWYYKVNKELAAIGKAKGSTEAGDNPMKSVLAVTIGLVLIVPVFLSIFGTWKVSERRGEARGSRARNGCGAWVPAQPAAGTGRDVLPAEQPEQGARGTASAGVGPPPLHND